MSRLSTTIVLGLSSAVLTCGQAPAAAVLPEALRTHLQDERFEVVTSIRGLPLGVRDELQTLWRSETLDIAEPGAEFLGSGAAAAPGRPTRRLAAAGCAPDHHCLVYYERGGPQHTWLVALFHWTPVATQFEFGGAAPAGLATIGDVRSAVLSGAIKANEVW